MCVRVCSDGAAGGAEAAGGRGADEEAAHTGAPPPGGESAAAAEVRGAACWTREEAALLPGLKEELWCVCLSAVELWVRTDCRRIRTLLR